MASLPTTYEELIEAIGANDSTGEAVKNPATGEVIGYVQNKSVDDLNEAIATARKAQKEWAKKSHAERSELLMKAADAIDACAEPLAQLLTREQGKPLNGPNSRFEVGGASAWTRATASFPLEPEEIVKDDETTAYLYYRPIGVVGAVGPWNWPMMISIWQIAPSLRMGNTIVLKPSEYTPLSVVALGYVLNAVLPEGLVQVLPGGRELGATLTSHEDIDKIMFTGSTATGKKIIEAAASTVKRMTLELGGNDAGIVLDDVDPKEFAEGIFWGAFINTGQTCAALKRLYVPASIYDEMCEALTEVAKNMPMGNGLEEENVLGPLQNKAQFDIVDGLVEEAKASGARVLIGGEPDRNQAGYFYPTTLVADIDKDNPLVVKEQFGPALPIIKYETLEEAIEEANKLDVGLGGSVWSPNRERAREVAAQIEAGTVWINNHGAIDSRIPFGGIKESGFGLEFGVEGLKHLGVPQIING